MSTIHAQTKPDHTQLSALAAERSLFIATLEATTDGILVVDLTGKIVRFNERFTHMWRIPDHILASRDDDQALAFVLSQLKYPEAFLQKVRDLYAQPETESFDVLEFNDGRVFERYSLPQRINGVPIGRVWSFRDVTDRVHNERARTQAEERAGRRLDRLESLWRLVAHSDRDRGGLAQALLDEGTRALGLSFGIISHADGESRVLDYSSTNTPIEFRRRRVALNESFAGLVHKANRTVACSDLAKNSETAHLRRLIGLGLCAAVGTTLRVGEHAYALVFAGSAPPSPPFDEEDREYVELVAAWLQRVLRVHEQDKQIAYLAYHDQLTGLDNRARFTERIGEIIPKAKRWQRRFALLYIDLDRFKEVNDNFGHALGDQVLVEAAHRLRAIIRQEDALSRFGGDEFAVLMPEVPSPTDAEQLAARICAVLSSPFRISGHDFYLSASIGIVLFPDDGENVEGLVTEADAAMYRAKEDGRDCYRFYSQDIAARLHDRHRLQEELRGALAREEFFLNYQPIVDLSSGRPVGAEALLRWMHSSQGLVRPDEFIPVAEEIGLMIPIGDWVLKEAFGQARAWSEAGLPLRLAVNLSARQLQDARFLGRLADALRDAGISAQMIEIEVTESGAFRDRIAAESILNQCKRMGFTIVLDDFGTHYASLTYLRKLPFDVIKIDRSFVSGLLIDDDDTAIVRSIIALGKSLNRKVVAEGVETEDQLRWLIDEGCGFAQGYLLGKPMSPPDFEHWLRAINHKNVAFERSQ